MNKGAGRLGAIRDRLHPMVASAPNFASMHPGCGSNIVFVVDAAPPSQPKLKLPGDTACEGLAGEYHHYQNETGYRSMWPRIAVAALLLALVWPSHAQTDAVAEWRKQVLARLGTNYPAVPPPGAAASVGSDRLGEVTVGFVLDRSGNIVSTWLIETTGILSLDRDGLAVVEHSKPFPKPPSGIGDDSLRFAFIAVFVRPPPAFADPVVAAKMKSICRGC